MIYTEKLLAEMMFYEMEIKKKSEEEGGYKDPLLMKAFDQLFDFLEPALKGEKPLVEESSGDTQKLIENLIREARRYGYIEGFDGGLQLSKIGRKEAFYQGSDTEDY